MRLHWARVDAIDSKPTLTKGEVEGVELGGAPISVCVLLDDGFAPIPDVQSEVRFDPNPFAAAA